MSHPHPTINAWTRDEHTGEYRSNQAGWRLSVSWHPSGHTSRGGFRWCAKNDYESLRGSDDCVEMETAMVGAEQAWRARDAEITDAIAAKADAASSE